jgi:hypothetical protein
MTREFNPNDNELNEAIDCAVEYFKNDIISRNFRQNFPQKCAPESKH